MRHTTVFARAAIAAAGAAIALTVAVSAQTSGRMVPVGDRWVCLRSDASHAQNATTNDNVALSCTQIAAAIPMRDGSGMMVIGSVQSRPADAVYAPSPSAALTPDQLNDQWNQFVRKTLRIPDVLPGGG